MHLPTLVSFLPLLVSLAAGQSASQAHSHYKDVCPHKDGRSEHVGDGVHVTYHCDKRPSSGKSTVVHAATSDACAKACANDSTCQASVWAGKTLNSKHSGQCILYSLAHDIKSDEHTLYMTHQDENDPFYVPAGYNYNYCKHEKAEISSLEDEVSDLKKQLAKAKKNSKGCFECPEWNRELYNDRGNEYKVYCGKLDDWGAANLAYYGDKTPKECVEACTDQKDCTRAIWPTAQPSSVKGACWLREYTDKAGPVPKTDSPAYASAHLQE